ncbi:hypothetical protein NLG97_g5588 [Lecanicillium saksenae]|uniref:Uncharacterized protein n=1 Tax=Lecanicillium saksenae TaxID=468837 RepID=A0ACC1QVV9_9HYPO|nr:hypothetical protein NLG97_g5588 [Lecanicillium saksenae]
MQFFVVASLVAAVMAMPAELVTRTHNIVCEYGLYTNVQCCGVDVLGVAGLDCHTITEVPNDANHANQICAKTGAAARCCVVPILGQALLCKDAI